MQAQLKSYATAGIALVGAGVIAVTPIAPPPTDISVRADHTHAVSLVADVDFFERASQAFDYIVDAGFGSGFEEYAPVAGAIDAMFRLSEGLGASAARAVTGPTLLPMALATAAAVFAKGQEEGRAALAHLIRQTVDGPAWALNPTLYALRDALPGPLGGADGFFADTQLDLGASSKELGDRIVALLGLEPAIEDAATLVGADSQPGALQGVDLFERAGQAFRYIIDAGFSSGFEEYAPVDGFVDGLFRVGEGLGASALRAIISAVLLPVGVITVATAFAEGQDEGRAAMAHFIRQTVDGPAWAVNPTLYALRDALPGELGGGADGFFADTQLELGTSSAALGDTIVSVLGLEGDNDNTEEITSTFGRVASAESPISVDVGRTVPNTDAVGEETSSTVAKETVDRSSNATGLGSTTARLERQELRQQQKHDRTSLRLQQKEERKSLGAETTRQDRKELRQHQKQDREEKRPDNGEE